MYVCMYVCMHACVHACMYVCMYAHMYAWDGVDWMVVLMVVMCGKNGCWMLHKASKHKASERLLDAAKRKK